MNLEALRQKLLAAARANPPDERVPYAFEKRVMAHLTSKPALDLGALWARAMWRAAAPCVAVSLLLLGVSSFVNTETSSAGEEGSPDLEETMLAVIDQSEEVW
jgi:hypothetical protein